MARTKNTVRPSQNVRRSPRKIASMTASGGPHTRRQHSRLPQWHYKNDLKVIAHPDGCPKCSSWMRHYTVAMTSGDPSLDTARQARDREFCALRASLKQMTQERNEALTKLVAMTKELEARVTIKTESLIPETPSAQSRKRPRRTSTPLPTRHGSEVIYVDSSSP